MTAQSSYQVIARRWRPRQFDEIVGQEHIVRTLKNAIQSNRIAHAYLFVGPRGTGKTTTARIFAKALNAEGGPNVAPDDNSEISKAILAGSCMDVIEIDGASNNGVEDVRQLREDVQYAPSQGNFKVYIIDEVHMLSNNAWNALLKTLEEPPAHVKFIFATTEAHKVLPTVVSRCQRFEFRPIPDVQIIGRLKQIAEAEGINADDAALASVARMADGGMRDAQSILDQLISFCGTTITEQNVLDVYGLASAGDITAMASAMAAADYEALFAKIEELTGQGRDLYRILQDLQIRVREALVEAIHGGGQTVSLGTALSAEALTRMLDGLQQGEDAVRTGLSQRVNFEVALLRAIDQSRSRAIDSVIKSLSQLAAGLPEDAGQKKIEISAAAKAATASGYAGAASAVAAAGGSAASGRRGSKGAPLSGSGAADGSLSGSAAEGSVPDLAHPFTEVRKPMRFAMLGGGATPFERSAASFLSGTAAKIGAKAASAAADSAAELAFSDSAQIPADEDGENPLQVAAFSPFSTPDTDDEGSAGDGWEQTLAGVGQYESEFISNPDDDEEGGEDGVIPIGGSRLAVPSMVGTVRSGGKGALVDTSRTLPAGTPEFNAAVEAVPELARQALEAFLRVQFRHLEIRGGKG